MMLILSPNPNYTFEIDDELLEHVDLKDSIQVVKETWVENVYQIQKTDFYDTNVFIDIGANIGAVSLYVSSFNDNLEVGQKPIKIYAYEPEVSNMKFLNKNVKKNNKVSQIRLIDKAVYSENGVWKMLARGGNSKLVKEGGYDVQVITLEDVFETNKLKECDVMKIDVEGSEYAIIQSSTLETLRRIKYLTLEFDRGHEQEFGEMIAKLSEVFNLHILGRPSTGGYIYGRRY